MPTQWKLAVYKQLKELRKKHDYSQQEVADMLNMGQNTYSELESGKTKLDLDRLYEIAGIYKISLAELLKDVPSHHG